MPAAADRGRRGEGEEVQAARCGDEAGAGAAAAEQQPAEDSPLGAVIGRASVVVGNTTTTTTTCGLQSLIIAHVSTPQAQRLWPPAIALLFASEQEGAA